MMAEMKRQPNKSSLYGYWGKANQENGEGVCWHPVAYHCLDVGACAYVLLDRYPQWLDKIASISEIEQSKLKKWLVFLIVLHDIGKFADGFQQMHGNPFHLDAKVAYDQHHDTLGFALVSELLPSWLGRASEYDFDSLMAMPWFAAVTGHHGRPPKDFATRAIVQRHFPANVLRDVEAFVSAIRDLLCPEGWMLPDPEMSPPEQQQQASWLVAGLTVLADWLGSNTRWFPYRLPDHPLPEYWRELAVPQAHRAVMESGMVGSKPAAELNFNKLFPALSHSPTPLQTWADSVDIVQGPQLFILEELTGAGKTEAALTLAGRLMAAGQTFGVYFALPTMATADAMYGRIRKQGENGEMWRNFFADGDPSLVLAHSAAKTAHKLEILRAERDSGYGTGSEEPSASQYSAAWLSDNRKKALLADFGVGTIDQALLAVLQLRHQSLRLLGLSSKMLVVDEVHACDCYMGELLGRLLQFHAALGGSAILLSATLPLEQRTKLLRHFAIGAGLDAPKPDDKNAYPLATHFHAGRLAEQQVQSRQDVSRSVFVDALSDEDAVFQRLYEIINKGGCAAWVRNTVADALDACHKWQDRYPDMPVTLFHARFALCDRLAIGSSVGFRFGPESGAEERRAGIVIATQVVEQSLDVDFDYLVTDLAPIDLVIQRAGRLQRHKRDQHGNRAEGDGRGGARLSLFTPKPEVDAPASWFKCFLPKAAAVYTDHGRLWLTARWLEKGWFRLPDDAREMIETVYGEDGYVATPEAFKKSSDKKHGACQSERYKARQNSLSFDYGYSSTGNNWPDEDVHAEIGTRLGEKTVRIRLAKLEGDRLIPWAMTGSNIDWSLSELTVAWRLVAAESTRNTVLLEHARKDMADEGRYCIIVPLERGNRDWRGWAANAQGKDIQVIYSATLGLRIEQGEATDESDL